MGFDRETAWPVQPVEGTTLRGGLIYAGVNGAPRYSGDPAAIKTSGYSLGLDPFPGWEKIPRWSDAVDGSR